MMVGLGLRKPGFLVGLAAGLRLAVLGRAGAQDGADRAAGRVVMPAEVLGQAADQVEAVAALGGLLARAAVTDDRPLGGSLIGDGYPDAEQPPGDLDDDEPAGLPRVGVQQRVGEQLRYNDDGVVTEGRSVQQGCDEPARGAGLPGSTRERAGPRWLCERTRICPAHGHPAPGIKAGRASARSQQVTPTILTLRKWPRHGNETRDHHDMTDVTFASNIA